MKMTKITKYNGWYRVPVDLFLSPNEASITWTWLHLIDLLASGAPQKSPKKLPNLLHMDFNSYVLKISF